MPAVNLVGQSLEPYDVSSANPVQKFKPETLSGPSARPSHPDTVSCCQNRAMTAPLEVQQPKIDELIDEDSDTDRPWIVIVWNDPINLMSYVAYIFQKVFGYSEQKANKLMMDVHQKGRAVVSSGNRTEAERDVNRLHSHGLWATMEHDE